MNLQYSVGLVILSAGLSAITGDLKSFTDARAKNPYAQFDWYLCAVKFVLGITVALVAMSAGLPKT
jgi:hypothetical protein